jgi:hypothetical protein
MQVSSGVECDAQFVRVRAMSCAVSQAERCNGISLSRLSNSGLRAP